MRVRKVLRIQRSTQRARSNQIIQLKRASDANSCGQMGGSGKGKGDGGIIGWGLELPHAHCGCSHFALISSLFAVLLHGFCSAKKF